MIGVTAKIETFMSEYIFRYLRPPEDVELRMQDLMRGNNIERINKAEQMRPLKLTIMITIITMVGLVWVIAGFLHQWKLNAEKFTFDIIYGEERAAVGVVELFTDIGLGYSEEEKYLADINENKASFVFERNGAIQSLQGLRIDPVTKQQNVELISLQISINGFPVMKWKGKEIIEAIEQVNCAELSIDKNGEAYLIPENMDPQLYVKKDVMTEAVGKLKNSLRMFRVAVAVLSYIFVVLIGSIVISAPRWFRFLCTAFEKLKKWVLEFKLTKALINFWQKGSQIKNYKRYHICSGITLAIWLVVLIIVIIIDFLLKYFDGLTMDEILFHLNAPITDTGSGMIATFFAEQWIKLVAGMVWIAILVVWLFRKNKNSYMCALSILLVLLLAVGECFVVSNKLEAATYFANLQTESEFIEENYVRPDNSILSFPEKKKNLIYIFLESMESTYLSMETGGEMEENVIPELYELAQNEISFSETDMPGGARTLTGSTWTIAGMVSETSGMPLLHISKTEELKAQTGGFLSNLCSLGDVLESQGYVNEIMVGSPIGFAGRDHYFMEHGDYAMLDYDWAKETERIPQNYNVWWGYEDEKLFSLAKDEILQLAKGTEPFNFTMLTVDTHAVGGYECRLCGNDYEQQYDNVLSCSSKQTVEFISWIKAQDFYEDTVIVIAGDHCTMDHQYMEAKFGKKQDKIERRVYNCFINSAVVPVKEKGRVFTTLDLFPSTLAAMGGQIEGDRLGLGTNLFSDKPTLCEEYGYENFDLELQRKSTFYDREILGKVQ